MHAVTVENCSADTDQARVPAGETVGERIIHQASPPEDEGDMLGIRPQAMSRMGRCRTTIGYHAEAREPSRIASWLEIALFARYLAPWRGLTEEVTLGIVHAKFTQTFDNCPIMGVFGDGLDPQSVAHLVDRRHQGVIAGI